MTRSRLTFFAQAGRIHHSLCYLSLISRMCIYTALCHFTANKISSIIGGMCKKKQFCIFQRKDVQRRLLDLHESQYMSSSVKLHVVNALDATTRFSAGLQWLLGWHALQAAVGTTVGTATAGDAAPDAPTPVGTRPVFS